MAEVLAPAASREWRSGPGRKATQGSHWFGPDVRTRSQHEAGCCRAPVCRGSSTLTRAEPPAAVDLRPRPSKAWSAKRSGGMLAARHHSLPWTTCSKAKPPRPEHKEGPRQPLLLSGAQRRPHLCHLLMQSAAELVQVLWRRRILWQSSGARKTVTVDPSVVKLQLAPQAHIMQR